ncbi:methyltransferase domain-containing protein [Dyadobacter sp. CY261]|uniref:class I SAM-dependent methyltransferase n=1 Tax=Dyadobacter sp. CY261 TaxID=2907203 RepID=UPI001F17A9DC|nr:methyltransferase domain-containing protein [Dyadobacter sp. CY261]MCF0070293.1 methyltransferase domain-containing protein [Dyadobacter sp. CY261]
MLNNYDRIASNYDLLSRLVFGKSIVRAQQSLLRHIKPHTRILIVGGGTGWILEEIAKIYPSGLFIDYVEISTNMLDLARKRDCKANQVRFIHTAIEDHHAAIAYDATMTPFLFDNFSTIRAAEVFQKMNIMLKKNGLWLFTDFHIDHGINRLWQKALLRSMYIFFKNISHVEADKLPEMHRHFNENGYETIADHLHFGGFIRSAAYCKSGNCGAVSSENKPLVEYDDR